MIQTSSEVMDFLDELCASFDKGNSLQSLDYNGVGYDPYDIRELIQSGTCLGEALYEKIEIIYRARNSSNSS